MVLRDRSRPVPPLARMRLLGPDEQVLLAAADATCCDALTQAPSCGEQVEGEGAGPRG